MLEADRHQNGAQFVGGALSIVNSQAEFESCLFNFNIAGEAEPVIFLIGSHDDTRFRNSTRFGNAVQSYPRGAAGGCSGL